MEIQKSIAAVTGRMRGGGRQTNSRGHRGVYGDTGIIAAHHPPTVPLVRCILYHKYKYKYKYKYGDIGIVAANY